MGLQLIDFRIDFARSVYVTKLMGELGGGERISTDSVERLTRNQRIHDWKIDWVRIALVKTHTESYRRRD